MSTADCLVRIPVAPLKGVDCMAKHISWTAWILFFAGMPIVFADHPGNSLCRFFGWGWSSGYHGWCSPTTWYGAGCGCHADAGCFECQAPMAPYDGSMLNPVHHAATRYYVPPLAYPPHAAPPAPTRTAHVAQRAPQFATPSMLQSR
jgi:hypothetical protein